MNTSELFMQDVIMSMSSHLEPAALSILKNVLIKQLSHYSLTAVETLPATADDSNEYIIKLFLSTKATKLSTKTVSYYLDTIKRLLTVIQKPLTEITSIDINYFLNTVRHDNTAVSLNNLRRSGLNRRVYPHLFRKTTATNIVRRGGSVHDAGEYLGHKDSSTAGKHYSFIGSEHTIDIFKKYVATI